MTELRVTPPASFYLRSAPEPSEWSCWMFGGAGPNVGLVYRPRKGHEPHALARWMMQICFDCRWVKDKPNTAGEGYCGLAGKP